MNLIFKVNAMKYCSKCGHELVDEAVVCIECGCPTQGATQKKKADPCRKAVTALNVLNFVFSMIAIFCMLFIIMSFTYSYVYAGPFSSYYHNYHTNLDWSFFAFVFADLSVLISFVTGIVTVIFAAMKKVNNGYVFSAITRFLLSAALFVGTLLMLMQGR